MNIFPILVFLAVTLTVVGVFFWLMPTRGEERVRALVEPQHRPASAWTETMVKLVGPLAQLSSPTGEGEITPLRQRFLQAGIRHPDAPLIYFGLKTLLPLALAALAFFALRTGGASSALGLLMKVLMAALVASYLPNLVLRLAIRARRREIFENFPDAADLMLVCVEAGMGLDAALSKVTEEIRLKSEALAQELHWTNLEMRAGSTREKSLHNLAVRTGVEEIGTFATMLTQADRFGTSIGESLRVFSDDLRHKRQTRAEEQAAKVPTKMLLPLVLCIFPVVSMVILTPAVIKMIRQLGPMLSGQ
ncbi:type II secretion system F family protein [Variovorax soli]|jgi:tight adherence protein C|uniref:type II secretion system F family protein n=1 Tax=Variovorax soli TaxID=376815 RepID=UPI0008381673|nr:type II secretion system F family protein [Variovorax soli]